jgi:hypothetical protein
MRNCIEQFPFASLSTRELKIIIGVFIGSNNNKNNNNNNNNNNNKCEDTYRPVTNFKEYNFTETVIEGIRNKLQVL